MFSLTTPDDHRNDMQPYEPFLTEATDNTAFHLEIVDELPAVVFHEELRQAKEAEEKAKKENREATAEEIKKAREKDKKTIPQRVNKKLKDVFTAAFRIIAEKSDAPARYLDFTLPTTTRTVKGKKSKAYDIPTKSTVNRYCIIKHRGKRKTTT